MKQFLYIILFAGQLIQAQTNNSHVVYFETGQYIVPGIETNRLVLFIQGLKDIEIERISIYGFTEETTRNKTSPFPSTLLMRLSSTPNLENIFFIAFALF